MFVVVDVENEFSEVLGSYLECEDWLRDQAEEKAFGGEKSLAMIIDLETLKITRYTLSPPTANVVRL